MTSMLSATSRPSPTPIAVPTTPTSAPCTTKMPITERGLAPRVRRIAMSDCLSVTVITSVETRLNAATAMISVRMMNISRFSTCTASNQLRLVRVQSRTTTSGPRLCCSARPTLARLVHVGQLQLHAGRPLDAQQLGRVVDVHQRQRAVVFVVAGVEGAGDGELLQPRHDARRRHLAAGRDQRHLVAFAPRRADAPARRRARCRTRRGSSGRTRRRAAARRAA